MDDSGLGRSIRELFEGLEEPAGKGSHPDGASSRPLPFDLGEDSGEEAGSPGEAPASAERTDPEAERIRAFSEAVQRYVEADAEGRADLEARIVEDARELRAARRYGALAEGVIALSLAGFSGGDDALVRLSREILDEYVATQLAVRIGREREPEAKENLHRVARVHPEILAPALADALAEADDRSVRRSLMDALRALELPGQEAAVRLLEDDRWYAVRNGVILLGEMGDGEAVQALTVPLGHEDPRVRKETVTALAKLGGEDAGLLVVGKLEDGAPEVRAAAAQAVGILRVERAQRVLERMLEEEESEDLIVPVIRALGQLGDPGAVPALEKRAAGTLFTRPSQDVRIAAYRALAAIGTPRARTLLEAGAKDKDQEVRYAVSMILKQAGFARSDEAEGETAEGETVEGEPAEGEGDGGDEEEGASADLEDPLQHPEEV